MPPSRRDGDRPHSEPRLLVTSVALYDLLLLGLVASERLTGMALVVGLIVGVILNERMARRLLSSRRASDGKTDRPKPED